MMKRLSQVSTVNNKEMMVPVQCRGKNLFYQQIRGEIISCDVLGLMVSNETTKFIITSVPDLMVLHKIP
jgi:hypothetical protein